MYLTSAELATGGRPTRGSYTGEYQAYASKIDSMADDIYRCMNFDQVVAFQQLAEDGAHCRNDYR